jgi:uncharacterized protein YfaS (alpha-2-macroglobulin family)
VLDSATAGQTLIMTFGQAVSPTLWLPGENLLQLVLGPEDRPRGRIYHAVTLSSFRMPQADSLAALQPHERSIGLQRVYRLRGSDEPATQFQRGDLVEVKLTLDVPQESWYVVVEDPLPAGFEALNERLGTTSHLAALYEEPVYFWQDHGYNRKDVRDKVVTFFATRLEPGQRTLTYLVRATSEGDFTALPTQAQLMYEPEVWSRSNSARLQVGAH